MKHGFILPDIVIAKVESCGTTEVASLFASTITRSDELVEEEPKKKPKQRRKIEALWTQGKGFIDTLFGVYKHMLKIGV